MAGTKTVVLDSGSETLRAGFSGEASPRLVCYNATGRPRDRALCGKEEYVGDEVLGNREKLLVRHTVEFDHISSFEGIEATWAHAFVRLGVAPEDCAVLATETPANPAGTTEKTVQLLFEALGCRAAHVVPHPIASLCSTGRASGFVLTQAGCVVGYPVFEGFTHRMGWRRLKDICDHDVAGTLFKCLRARGQTRDTFEDRRSVGEMRRKICYALNGAATEDDTRAVAYTLPDGRTVTVGAERHRAPEGLFQPSLIGRETIGLPEFAVSSIALAAPHFGGPRAEESFFANIVLEGDDLNLPGVAERMAAEVTVLKGGGTPGERDDAVRICGTEEYARWRGGSLLASSEPPGPATSRWMTREEYDESGPSLVFERCRYCLPESA
ncbi:Actin-6 [Diplonema papillatum]|nr:Actin-6 [Diplonema papillatum]